MTTWGQDALMITSVPQALDGPVRKSHVCILSLNPNPLTSTHAFIIWCLQTLIYNWGGGGKSTLASVKILNTKNCKLLVKKEICRPLMVNLI